MSLTYRFLQTEEWDRLDELVNGEGPIPPPTISNVAVAEDEDGEIVGALFLQLALHMEPLIITEKGKGKVDFRSFKDLLEASIASAESVYYVFSPDAKIGKMCRVGGMTQLPYKVWMKHLVKGKSSGEPS